MVIIKFSNFQLSDLMFAVLYVSQAESVMEGRKVISVLFISDRNTAFKCICMTIQNINQCVFSRAAKVFYDIFKEKEDFFFNSVPPS